MDKKEKELLDYLYTVGQNVRDFMRRNGHGFQDAYRVVSVDVTLTTDEKHDMINTMSCISTQDGVKSMVKKMDNILENKIEYKVVI